MSASSAYIYIYIFQQIKSSHAFILYRLFHTGFDICNLQECKCNWVKMTTNLQCNQLVTKLDFHFHHSSEKVAGNVETMGPNLLSRVESCQVWFSDDEKPLFRAQHASLCHWVERCSSIQNSPGNRVG